MLGLELSFLLQLKWLALDDALEPVRDVKMCHGELIRLWVVMGVDGRSS
jgi:hypothetical protein